MCVFVCVRAALSYLSPASGATIVVGRPFGAQWIFTGTGACFTYNPWLVRIETSTGVALSSVYGPTYGYCGVPNSSQGPPDFVLPNTISYSGAAKIQSYGSGSAVGSPLNFVLVQPLTWQTPSDSAQLIGGTAITVQWKLACYDGCFFSAGAAQACTNNFAVKLLSSSGAVLATVFNSTGPYCPTANTIQGPTSAALPNTYSGVASFQAFANGVAFGVPLNVSRQSQTTRKEVNPSARPSESSSIQLTVSSICVFFV